MAPGYARHVPKPTTVLMIRHGQTPTTGRVLPGRAPGLHLSEVGREQAAGVADRLANLPIAALFTSPLERARETAAPTTERLGLAATPDDGLLECDFGDWTGRTLSSLSRLKAWRTVQQTPSTFRFPGGESFAEAQSRVVDAVERLRHPEDTIACFSHADPIKLLLTHCLGAPLDHLQRLHVDTGSISVIEWPNIGPPLVRAVNTHHGSLADG